MADDTLILTVTKMIQNKETPESDTRRNAPTSLGRQFLLMTECIAFFSFSERKSTEFLLNIGTFSFDAN